MIGSSAYMFPMDHGNQKRPLVAWATGDPYEICVCSPPPLSLNIYFRTSNLVPEKDKISWPKIRTAKYYYWWQKKVIWYLKHCPPCWLDFRNFTFVLQLVRSQKETSFYVLKHFFLINFSHHHKFIDSSPSGQATSCPGGQEGAQKRAWVRGCVYLWGWTWTLRVFTPAATRRRPKIFNLSEIFTCQSMQF